MILLTIKATGLHDFGQPLPLDVSLTVAKPGQRLIQLPNLLIR
jgi:hypothetical protein